ncbi:unnamed protein product [Toxocara canis]|uniref:RING-type domain-containing protein n=1 Tax=Toxocara canis TaxID=6265 RepID=A0A183UDV7_TOXCA|nr:unnamed protein product [Toxocara canis]
MHRLEYAGVLSAVNAFALHDNGRFAYLFDPRVNATIRVDLSTGTRDVLKWYDHSFHHPRWLCYCMFTMHRDNSTYLPTLFFNKKRKMFVLVTFLLDQSKYVLHKLQENTISVEPIRPERLAYNAHKDEHKLHSVHFISTERTTTQLASMPLDAIESTGTWNIRTVLADNNDAHPARKAVWCNAWRAGMAWYVVCEKNITELEITRTITIWQLDVLDCRWRKLPVEIAAPATAANFAVRIELNNIAYLHCDWERDAVFHKFDLNELMLTLQLQRQDAPLAAIEEEAEEECEISPLSLGDNPDYSALSSTEIVCPICLDTYDDPRTLSCGHSVCNNCVEQMKATAQNSTIRCFACRKATTIPATGLPVNFGLRDAIETLEKARQLSLSNLRCGRCRTHCEESGMWICLKCCQEQAVIETSFSSTKEEQNDAAGDSVDAITAMTKKYSFCAPCILKYHSDHRVDELSKFRERWKYAKEKNLKCNERVSEILKNLKVSFVKHLEPSFLQPLRRDASSDLQEACDPVANNTQMITSEADEAIVKFESRVSALIENIDANLKVMLEQSLNTASRCDRPTQL